ncbi:MAG TPA: DUF1800 domain-containing protein [Pirellulales bacterium]|nr:DUF1800 domain-containing protein [Pirellulales bacterium]
MSRHLRPWTPSDSRPFDERAAAHLLRRAGFGAPPAEVAAAVERGLEATVDSLLDSATDEDAEFQRTFDTLGASFVNLEDIGYLQAWWVYRMLRTRVPLKEKLALFWHGHFATSQSKVDDAYLMHRQLDTLRQRGAGSFRDLVLGVARDPAMLVYLDGETSGKEHPNENFARELMELFTCGIGHYKEQDVLEAARAFTGWHREGAEFSLNAEVHDDGRKQFLGYAGRFDGTDIIDVLMQQAATSRWIAGKLLRYFASPDPASEVLDEAAQLFDRTQMNIKWFLRELLLSEYFFSPACYRRRIASPVEYVVGTARTLGLSISGESLKNHISAMGQDLFLPPNVKGWDGERKWINSSTWGRRLAFARDVANLYGTTPFSARLDLEALVRSDLVEPQQVVNRLAEVLLQGEIDAPTKAQLATLLITTDDGKQLESFREDAGFRGDRTRAALDAMLSLPQYHVC